MSTSSSWFDEDDLDDLEDDDAGESVSHCLYNSKMTTVFWLLTLSGFFAHGARLPRRLTLLFPLETGIFQLSIALDANMCAQYFASTHHDDPARTGLGGGFGPRLARENGEHPLLAGGLGVVPVRHLE
jgi:hypothetical protein